MKHLRKDEQEEIEIIVHVKRERKRRRWSLRTLERISTVSKTHLNNIENGVYEPTISITYKISRAFKIDINDLIEVKVKKLSCIQDK